MNGQMVRADTGEMVDPYQEMDRLDEDQILAELKGASLDRMIYQFGNVTGLSVAGVRESVRQLNKYGQARIRVAEREPIVIETDDYIEVRVYAEDPLNGGGNWGIKRQEKFATARNGNKTPDVFALEKALSKAQRNALRALIPEAFVAQMIKEFQQQQRRGDRAQERKEQRTSERAPRQMPPPNNTVPVQGEVVSMEESLGRKILDRARKSAETMSHEPATNKVSEHIAGILFEALGEEADCDLLVRAIFGNGLKGLRADQASFIAQWANHEHFKKQANAALVVAKTELAAN